MWAFARNDPCSIEPSDPNDDGRIEVTVTYRLTPRQIQALALMEITLNDVFTQREVDQQIEHLIERRKRRIIQRKTLQELNDWDKQR